MRKHLLVFMICTTIFSAVLGMDNALQNHDAQPTSRRRMPAAAEVSAHQNHVDLPVGEEQTGFTKERLLVAQREIISIKAQNLALRKEIDQLRLGHESLRKLSIDQLRTNALM